MSDIMSKDLFIESINYVKDLMKEQERFNDLLHEIDGEFGGGYIHSKSIDFILHLVKELSNDKYDNISYYCWELDFGDKYEEGCITEEDGTPIPLSTPEDLWNLIQSENE